PVKVFEFGPKQTRAIGVVTGAAGSEIYRAADGEIDTFITGEAPHWAAVAAEELGMNLLLGGHYATEVFGVKRSLHICRNGSGCHGTLSIVQRACERGTAVLAVWRQRRD